MLPSGAEPCRRTFHQGRANPNGTATSPPSRRRKVCPDTRGQHFARYSRYESSSKKPFPVLHLYSKLATTSESSSEKLFPVNWPLLSPAPKSSFPYHICTTKLATSESSSEKLFPLLHLYYKLAILISHLRFAPSTRTISAEGCAGEIRNALSLAFCPLDTHDLRRGLRRTGPERTLACVSRPRTISAEGCAGPGQNALSPAFRALDTHDLRRGLPAPNPKRISRPRHARSPQRVARDRAKTHSRLHFAPSTRTISAEGCAGPGQIELSPPFRALDARDLRRGLPATGPKRTLAGISRPRRARSPQRVAFRGAPAALPPALRK